MYSQSRPYLCQCAQNGEIRIKKDLFYLFELIQICELFKRFKWPIFFFYVDSFYNKVFNWDIIKLSIKIYYFNINLTFKCCMIWSCSRVQGVILLTDQWITHFSYFFLVSRLTWLSRASKKPIGKRERLFAMPKSKKIYFWRIIYNKMFYQFWIQGFLS